MPEICACGVHEGYGALIRSRCGDGGEDIGWVSIGDVPILFWYGGYCALELMEHATRRSILSC